VNEKLFGLSPPPAAPSRRRGGRKLPRSDQREEERRGRNNGRLTKKKGREVADYSRKKHRTNVLLRSHEPVRVEKGGDAILLTGKGTASVV